MGALIPLCCVLEKLSKMQNEFLRKKIGTGGRKIEEPLFSACGREDRGEGILNSVVLPVLAHTILGNLKIVMHVPAGQCLHGHLLELTGTLQNASVLCYIK